MRYVVVGNGPAAIAAVEAIRERDSRGVIVMIARENLPFYSPCPLAEYIEDSVPRERLFLRDTDFYARNGVETMFGEAVSRLDAGARAVVVGEKAVSYDRLLIANGAQAFRPPVPGLADTPGVFALKTLADAESILARLGQLRRAVVIGSGFIGLEAAQALVRRGVAVTVLEALDRPLPAMLDGEMAAMVAARLRAHGVDLQVSTTAQQVLGGESGVRAVRAGGEEIACELVVCAAGVRPDVGWLAGSGLDIGRGLGVDDRMRTNLPDVYAAGDIIETEDWEGRRQVIPNWPNAVAGGRVAGVNMARGEARFRGLEAINVVRIFEVPVSSFGSPMGERTLELESGGSVRKLTLSEGRIVGGQFYGDVDGTGVYHELMKKRVDVRHIADRLLSSHFSLAPLLPTPGIVRRFAA